MSGAGVLLCIEKALAQSGVNKTDVNYVNAHATSTKAGDLQEYKALMKAFGGNPEVSSCVLQYLESFLFISSCSTFDVVEVNVLFAVDVVHSVQPMLLLMGPQLLCNLVTA